MRIRWFKKKRECDFCRDISNYNVSITMTKRSKQKTLEIEKYMGNRVMLDFLDDINFCPYCGRRIKNGGWNNGSI